MRRVAWVVLLAALGVPAAASAQNLAAPLPLDPAIRAATLPNGLTYFIRKNGRPENRVSLRLAVKAGSIEEADDQRGLAHFLEHMAFNGTAHFKPGELVQYLESVGARFGPHVNAYTSYDETVYMLDVPTDRAGFLDRGMVALADFAGGMTLDPAEIDRERGVVIEEWRQRRGAGARVQEIQAPALYGPSRYVRRDPIGTTEVLKSFKPERLRAFYEEWYRPDRMAVVIVGDIDPVEAETLIARHFSGLERRADRTPRPVHPIPLQAATRYAIAVDREAQQSSVTMIYKRPLEVERTAADYRRSLVEGLAFQMLNARLAEIARQPKAPFLGASTGGDRLGQSVEAFVMSARVADGGIAPGLQALAEEAARVRQHGFGEAELERGRKATLAAYERMHNERNTAESAGLAAELVRHFLEQEPVPGMEAEFEMARRFMPSITARETADAARRMLQANSQAVLAVAPDKPGVSAPTEAALRTALRVGLSATMVAWRDDMGGRELLPKKPEAGSLKATRQIPELGVTVLTLSNGVEVWLKPTDFKNDQILFTGYAKGGLSLASPAEYNEADLATSLVGVAGIGGFTPVELEKLLPGQLVSASPFITDYTQGMGGSSTPRDLETALQLLYLYFIAPNRTPESFDLLQRQLSAALANRAQSPSAVFGERLAEINAMGHYSVKPLRPQDLDTLRPERMRGFYDARFANADDFTFFMVGTFEIAQVTPLLTRYLGGLPSNNAPASKIGDMRLQFPPNVVRETVKKGQEPQSRTVMSFFADTGLDEMEMHRLRAACSVLEMRLRDLLREELGGTYGVGVGYSNTQPQGGYGTVSVSFGSAPETVDTLVSAVLKEVERLRAEGPTPDEVQKVKEIERRELETSARSNAYWMNSLQTVHLLGWDPLSIARRPQRTESLSMENVHAPFKKYFPSDRYTVVTLLPEK